MPDEYERPDVARQLRRTRVWPRIVFVGEFAPEPWSTLPGPPIEGGQGLRLAAEGGPGRRIALYATSNTCVGHVERATRLGRRHAETPDGAALELRSPGWRARVLGVDASSGEPRVEITRDAVRVDGEALGWTRARRGLGRPWVLSGLDGRELARFAVHPLSRDRRMEVEVLAAGPLPALLLLCCCEFVLERHEARVSTVVDLAAGAGS